MILKWFYFRDSNETEQKKNNNCTTNKTVFYDSMDYKMKMLF